MAVYVDNPIYLWRGERWCHMVADSLDELHAFAALLEIPARAFQAPPRASRPHYDLPMPRREQALALGAIHAERRVIVACARRLHMELQAAGSGETLGSRVRVMR